MLYRIEIWIHNSINSEEAKQENALEQLKKYLKENFGSEIEDKPIS